MPFPWVNQDQPAVYYATDLARTVVDRPVIATPSGPFTYNDYGPNLVGLAYERLTGKLLTDEPLRQLWQDIGAEDPVLWCVDDHSIPYHESGMVVTASPGTDTIVVRMGDDDGGNIHLAIALQDLAHRAVS